MTTSPDPAATPGPSTATVLLAGATGDLGARTARELVARGAGVRALVRPTTDRAALARLAALGVTAVEADYADPDALVAAASGADVVVSAVSGLRPVVVDAQTRLLDAAVRAGVPRFVPSDYSIDYTGIPEGSNRNLQLRRDFRERVDASAIGATSVLNGGFADMLTGVAPLVLFDRQRVLYWRDADQPMDFTTMDDTASFTADAALDPDAPRFLRIAGDQVSARDVATIMTDLTGTRYRLTYAGGIAPLRLMARAGRALSRDREALYPAWQGMQYFANMFGGEGRDRPLANDRYGVRRWTSAREVLAAR